MLYQNPILPAKILTVRVLDTYKIHIVTSGATPNDAAKASHAVTKKYTDVVNDSGIMNVLRNPPIAQSAKQADVIIHHHSIRNTKALIARAMPTTVLTSDTAE